MYKVTPKAESGGFDGPPHVRGCLGVSVGRLRVNAILGGPGFRLCSAGQRLLVVHSVHLSS